MKQASIAEILELPVHERIELAELIWDSVAAVPEALPVEDELKRELESYLQEFRTNPGQTFSWEEVKDLIRNVR